MVDDDEMEKLFAFLKKIDVEVGDVLPGRKPSRRQVRVNEK